MKIFEKIYHGACAHSGWEPACHAGKIEGSNPSVSATKLNSLLSSVGRATAIDNITSCTSEVQVLQERPVLLDFFAVH